MEFDLVLMKQHIIIIILFNVPNNQPWAPTFVRSPCDWSEKERFWEDVDNIGCDFASPWMVFGDFNSISGQDEKWGGKPVVSSSRDGLYQLKLNHGMMDVDNSGPRFIWCNGWRGRHQIRERLDKGLANGEWSTLFPKALV